MSKGITEARWLGGLPTNLLVPSLEHRIVILLWASVYQGGRLCAQREKSPAVPLPKSGQSGLGRSQDSPGVTVRHPKQATMQNSESHGGLASTASTHCADIPAFTPTGPSGTFKSNSPQFPTS